MSKHKVLVADPIADAGIDELKADDSLDVDVRIGISEEELLKDVTGRRAPHPFGPRPRDAPAPVFSLLARERRA